MKSTTLFLLLLLALSLWPASGQQKFDNNTIVQSVQGGVQEELLLRIIQSYDNTAEYTFGPDEVARLKKAGVSNRVIQAMMERMSNKPQVKQETVPEPDQEGIYYFYDETTQQLTALSLEMGFTKGKNKLGGFGGVKVLTEMQGERAAVRFTPNGPYSFLVRVAGGGSALSYLDESTLVLMAGELHAFTGRKGKRERTAFDYTYYGIGGIGKAKTTIDSGASLKVTKAAGNILRIRPSSPLPPGEYGFSVPVDMRAVKARADVMYYVFAIGL